MTCEQAVNLISQQIDGEISPADLAELEAHLGGCAACRTTADALAMQDGSLRRAFAQRRAAAELADRVLERWHQPPLKLPPGIPWLRTILAAAAGFGLALLILHPWTPAPSHPIAGTMPATQPAAEPVAGQLALATGRVDIQTSASAPWQALATGGAVARGSRLRTGPEIRCELVCPDGSELRLNESTEVVMGGPRQVQLVSGQAFSRVSPSPEPYVVQAVQAKSAFTALGTSFDVSCVSSTATLTVVDGTVRVDGASARDTVRAGESLSVTDGALQQRRQVQNLAAATRWVEELLILKGRDNPELTRRIDDLLAQLGQNKMSYLASEEIRRLGDHCVMPLTRYIQSDRSRSGNEQERRREAARIIGDVATTWAIPELINLLGDDDGEVRYWTARALERLTGQTMQFSATEWRDRSAFTCAGPLSKWQEWWEKNRHRYPGAARTPLKKTEVEQKALR